MTRYHKTPKLIVGFARRPHPEYWSLMTIYYKLRYGLMTTILTNEDIIAYKKLNVRGKRVLDGGAFIGDTAQLFLKWGAAEVFCVEQNPEYASRIKTPNTTVFPEKFSRKHLELPWEVLKLDIEEYELEMLPYLKNESRPMVVEVHGLYALECFQKAGFVPLNKIAPPGFCIVGKNLEGVA